MENRLLQKTIMILLIVLFCGTCFTVSAKRVDLKGRWKDIKRSQPVELPISVYVENNQLVIQSDFISSDIMVMVSYNGVTVYENTMFASSMYQYSIDIKGWKNGNYKIKLSNKWGNYLVGWFDIVN